MCISYSLKRLVKLSEQEIRVYSAASAFHLSISHLFLLSWHVKHAKLAKHRGFGPHRRVQDRQLFKEERKLQRTGAAALTLLDIARSFQIIIRKLPPFLFLSN
ncbi:hypothetical protein CHARACLAT_005241 [Characodon lateralis]|uniref:Uncharacterized protein n=1 Tax=Characodon lateralis TaxID=208331 RepID=A0ABU7DXV3_9TELE|nr:hypothetical protein [Characodon lateralis]